MFSNRVAVVSSERERGPTAELSTLLTPPPLLGGRSHSRASNLFGFKNYLLKAIICFEIVNHTSWPT